MSVSESPGETQLTVTAGASSFANVWGGLTTSAFAAEPPIAPSRPRCTTPRTDPTLMFLPRPAFSILPQRRSGRRG
jgi:hypothetical protein